MKKETVWILAFVFVILICGCAEHQNRVCFNENCFSVEISQTPEARELGLMHRNSLASDSGMLFIFEGEGKYPIWMKDTLIPLDIIWMNGERTVVSILKNNQPCNSEVCNNSYPSENALYVLEVNAGTCDKIGLNIGDSVIIE